MSWDSNPERVNTSSQTAYPSPRRKRQGLLTSLLVLSPHDPLRWARAGTPNQKQSDGLFLAAKSAAAMPQGRMTQAKRCGIIPPAAPNNKPSPLGGGLFFIRVGFEA